MARTDNLATLRHFEEVSLGIAGLFIADRGRCRYDRSFRLPVQGDEVRRGSLAMKCFACCPPSEWWWFRWALAVQPVMLLAIVIWAKF